MIYVNILCLKCELITTAPVKDFTFIYVSNHCDSYTKGLEGGGGHIAKQMEGRRCWSFSYMKGLRGCWSFTYTNEREEVLVG